jgi:hypothetical protein
MAQSGAPNFLSAIVGGYEQGADRAERSRLRDLAEEGRRLAGGALQGNQNDLARLAGVDSDAFMKVKSFTREEKAARLDELASGAMAADTPEKWQAFVQRSEAMGHRIDPGETRESILDQAMGWKEKLAQSNADRSFDASQKNADRGYNLDVRQFNASQSNANRNYQLQRDQLSLKDPDLVELYDKSTGQPYKARYNPKTGGYDQVGGVKAPSGTSLEVGPDGTVSFTQGMGKMTEGQSKDVGYLNRMTSALPAIDKHESALLSFGEGVGGQAPLVGNYLKSSDYQLAEQAGNNFLTALLRKESGATVPPAEQKSYGAIFLPQPGDKPAVIAQKREARRQAAVGVKMGLPAHIIKNMIQQGVDFTALDPNAAPGPKGDAQPRRTKSGVEWSPQ